MNINKILFPTDFSEFNTACMQLCIAAGCREAGALLYIVHVNEQSVLNASMGEASYLYASEWESDIRKTIHDQLSRVRPTATNVTFEHVCLDAHLWKNCSNSRNAKGWI